MSDTIPSIEVTAPTATPYPFGLFTVAPTSIGEARWTAGIWWRSQACNLVGVTFNPCQVDDDVPAKDVNVECSIVTAPSFTVYARSADSLAGASIADKFANARTALLAGEQFAAETALWEMLLAATSSPDGTAADVQEAIAMAEAQIAAVYGGTGVIHLSRYSAIMAGTNVLSPSGTRLTTLLGSHVIAGGGYDEAPAESGAVVSVIATGGVNLVRGEVFDLGQHFDTDTNSISAVVERSYAIGWDCAAVRIETSEPA